MANFTTHIAVGTVVSGALATLTLAADVIAPENLIAVTMAGVLGSILPDIDLKDSRPSKAMFSGLGIFFSFAVLFSFATKYSIAELWIIWLGTLVLFRYGLHTAFHNLAIHRGIWHSILAAFFSAGATAVVFYYVLGRHEGVAWLAGAFLFIGYITHLILDEVYSVDVMDTRVKASFGTALKLFDRRYPYASLGMLAATVAVLSITPPTKTFMDGMSSRNLWAGLNERLLPEDKWFGLIDRHGGLARVGTTAPADGITTGSIPPAPEDARPATPPPAN